LVNVKEARHSELQLLFYFLIIIGVRVCTSDAYVVLSVCDCALLIMVDSDRWLYLIVTFIEVKVIVAVTSLRVKTEINTIFSLSKKITLQLKNYLVGTGCFRPEEHFIRFQQFVILGSRCVSRFRC
jgi:hypothetical protein